LQPAEAEIETNTMSYQIGLKPFTTRPLLHFTRRIDVVAWMIERMTDEK
jgi:hypothetical protein